MRNVSEQNQGEDVTRPTSSATSYNNSQNQQTQQTSSSQHTQRVNRVAFDLPVAQESNLVFDVTGCDVFSNLRVAVISEDFQLSSFADASKTVEHVL